MTLFIQFNAVCLKHQRQDLSLLAPLCRKCAGLLLHDGERHRSGGGVRGAVRHQLPQRGWRPVPVGLQHCQPGPGLLQHPGRRLAAGDRGPAAGHAASVCPYYLLRQHEELPRVHAHTDPAHLPRWVSWHTVLVFPFSFYKSVVGSLKASLFTIQTGFVAGLISVL